MQIQQLDLFELIAAIVKDANARTPADPTEHTRRAMVAEIAANAKDERAELEKDFGQVWTTSELQEDFTIDGFMAPFCIVRRKADGLTGTLQFQHAPRFYYSFVPDNA